MNTPPLADDGQPDAPIHHPFAVLVVCTGNICRSPAVERLLAAGLGSPSGVVVGSAGTRAVVGAPVSAPMVPLLVGAGASADDFAARQLTHQLVDDADLVLGLTRGHRAAIVHLVPNAVRRTFTLRELARLTADVDHDELPAGRPAERLAALVALAAGRRTPHPARPAQDDVVDPYGLGDAAYARSFGQLKPAVDAILRLATG
ncbi:protein-tyrosine-phosphatase [Cellulomonas sp. KRMCY2]|uniref:arsenate reductase/protein-tyrosine-phosphatase family protein n=1 Tax=Cellulomonas sp. KRMCY2 TaxID=1304865 RepID=UPI00045E9796|nr:protein-tyrosine-phosphatase [Cellulomonas sp. KRMCY2]